MISVRYLPATCVLLALALVPTIIHSYSTDAGDDGRRTAAVPTELAGYTSRPSDRNAAWGQRRFDSHDWVEREYRDVARGHQVTLTVVRSYDAKSVYHHPELAVAYGVSFVGQQVIRLPQRPDVPVHVLKPSPGVPASAAYVLHYDARFVENPIAFQIRTAGELLVTRRKPMTLFFAQSADAREQAEQVPSASVLLAAVDAFLKRD